MSEKSEIVKVRISAQQTVRYDQVVKMTREEFEDLKDQVEAADGTFPTYDDPVSERLDLTDIFDCDDIEDVEVELEE